MHVAYAPGVPYELKLHPDPAIAAHSYVVITGTLTFDTTRTTATIVPVAAAFSRYPLTGRVP